MKLERPKAVNRAIERFIGVRRSRRGDIEGEDVFWEEGLP